MIKSQQKLQLIRQLPSKVSTSLLSPGTYINSCCGTDISIRKLGRVGLGSGNYTRQMMKTKPLASIVMVLLLVLGILEVNNKASAEVSAAACKEERRLGINACKPVVYGRLPSPACCERVRVSHIECVCPVVTPKLAALVDVNRAIRLIEGCGRRVPRHYKCGSITTP